MTTEVKRIVHEVLDELVQRDPTGERWTKELYLDHYDRELDEETIKTIARSPDPRGYFYEITDNAFMDYRASVEADLIKDVSKALDAAGMVYDEDEVREYIYDRVDISVPVDEILANNSVCVNIIVDTGNANYEFTKNSFAHSYYGGEGIEDESSLLWLAKQQGAAEDDLKRAFNEGTAFDANTLNIIQERDAAQRMLESYGKGIVFGAIHERNKGKYAEAKRIEDELGRCTKDRDRHEKTLADLPKTFDEYNAMCNERGLSLRFSTAEAFEEKRNEIAQHSERRIKELSARIASLEKEIEDKDLTVIYETEQKFMEASGKVAELAQTDAYKKARMLDSLIECSASTTSSMNALTFCVKMPLAEYLNLREAMAYEESLNSSFYPTERNGTGEIVLSSKTHTILYDAWSGAGSCSDVELCADVHLPIRLIDSANPDSIDGYGVREIYGTNSSFYSDTLVEIVSMPEKEMEPRVSTTPILPEGWVWKDYDDGSGSLQSPEGKSYFSYDLLPYAAQGEIEYRRDNDRPYTNFYGSLSEFKAFAESAIKEDILKQRQSLSDKIAAAKHKAEEIIEPTVSKEKDTPEI